MPSRRQTTNNDTSPAAVPEGIVTLSSLHADGAEAERGTGMANRSLEQAAAATESVTLTAPTGTKVTTAKDAAKGLKALGFK